MQEREIARKTGIFAGVRKCKNWLFLFLKFYDFSFLACSIDFLSFSHTECQLALSVSDHNNPTQRRLLTRGDSARLTVELTPSRCIFQPSMRR